MKTIWLRTFVIALLAASAQAFAASIPKNESLDRAYSELYDLQFDQANTEILKFEQSAPNDPLGPVSEAASTLFQIFDQHDILQADFFSSDTKYGQRKPIVVQDLTLKRFESALNRAESLGNAALSRSGNNSNALFALTLVYGLRADYASLIDRKDFLALRYSSKATEFANTLLKLDASYNDAYVATGIQKYLVSLRPAPVRWLLRIGGIRGDQDEAVRELTLASDKGHYLAPFARILLAVAHLRRKEPTQASQLLAQLHQQFPDNPLFVKEFEKLRQTE